MTVQRRCRLTYLFPAGATPRRPAEPLPAQSPPPPARRDSIGAATDGAAGTEWILRRCRSGCRSQEDGTPGQPCTRPVGTGRHLPRAPPPHCVARRRASPPRHATASHRHVPCSALRRTYFGVRAVAPSDPLWPASEWHQWQCLIAPLVASREESSGSEAGGGAAGGSRGSRTRQEGQKRDRPPSSPSSLPRRSQRLQAAAAGHGAFDAGASVYVCVVTNVNPQK